MEEKIKEFLDKYGQALAAAQDRWEHVKDIDYMTDPRSAFIAGYVLGVTDKTDAILEAVKAFDPQNEPHNEPQKEPTKE